jgi:spore coat polysaccharide biosynthesis predicted glycosyltransferase SpsG
MTPGMRVLFRADSGAGIGHGHATRVEALSRATIRAGGEARIVMRPLPGHRPPAADLAPVLWLQSDEPMGHNDDARVQDAEWTVAAARDAQFGPDVVVADHYELGPVWERLVRASGAYVVALDDFPGRPHAADLVVELLPAPASAPERVAGIEFLPMDRAFALPPRFPTGEGERLLITFGGSDPTGHTALALDALDLLDAEQPRLVAHADVVLGAAHPAPEAIRARVLAHPRRSLHQQLPSLVPLMASATVVLTAAGNAMTEAVAAGRFTVAVVTVENQAVLATALGDAGVATVLPDATQATARAMADAVRDITGPSAPRVQAALARRPVDANGADRLLAAIADRAQREAA